MTNKRHCYLLILKNKNCQNIKRLPQSFTKVKEKNIKGNDRAIFIYICRDSKYVERNTFRR